MHTHRINRSILLAAALAAAGCSAPGDEFARTGADRVPEPERVAAIMQAFMAGPQGVEFSQRGPSLDELLMGQAHAVVADYDFCASSDSPAQVSVSKRGPSGAYGSALDRISLSSTGSYCQDPAGTNLQNTNNTQFKTWSASGMLLECSWGASYNLSGAGVYRKPTDESMLFYGTYSASGGPGSGTWDCSVDGTAGATTTSSDGINGMSCTNAAGQSWSELQNLAASSGSSCTLSFGSVPLAAPTAVCGAGGSGFALDTVTFDGSGSTDPYNRPLTYSWAITSAPVGSGSALASASSASSDFQMDLVGDYFAQLTVTTADGTTDTCTERFTAAAHEALRVEMWWDETDDMDLHMLRPDSQGGAVVFTRPGDAGWFNLNPEWGDPSSTLDNPSLDLDDIWATGPENINIEQPATGPYAGWYTIYVHDYPYTVQRNTPNMVHVRIYLDGSIAKTYDFSISGEDAYYYVAKVQWPTGAIQECFGLAGC